MIPVRLELTIRCTDYKLFLQNDLFLPAAFVGLELRGLWPEDQGGAETIESLQCNVPGGFLEASLRTHSYRTEEQDRRYGGGRDSKRMEEILPGYLTRGWRLDDTGSYWGAPDLGNHPTTDYTPWTGPPIARSAGREGGVA